MYYKQGKVELKTFNRHNESEKTLSRFFFKFLL